MQILKYFCYIHAYVSRSSKFCLRSQKPLPLFCSTEDATLVTATLNPTCHSKKFTRKRTINQDQWKSSKRLKAAQHGEAYTTVRGVLREARSVKTLKDCSQSCKFKCTQFFEMFERKAIHDQYWSESQVGKDNFIIRTSENATKKTR